MRPLSRLRRQLSQRASQGCVADVYRLAKAVAVPAKQRPARCTGNMSKRVGWNAKSFAKASNHTIIQNYVILITFLYEIV